MIERPLSWCEALEAEYLALYGTAAIEDPATPESQERLRRVYARIHERRASALCLSGGGIRSATFALGVLQGLAHLGVLGKFDYLSTVSGGGYIGGWFTAWLHRQAPDREAVFRALDPTQPPVPDKADDDTSPVDRVRRTCKYLAPSGGLLSADMWTVIVTTMRNLLLNWMVLLPLLAATLLIPRFYFAIVHAVEVPEFDGPCLQAGTTAWWLLGAAGLQYAVCFVYAVASFVGLGGNWSQGRFLFWCLGPLVGGTIALTLFWSASPCHLPFTWLLLISAVMPALGWTLVGAIAPLIRPQNSDRAHGLRIRVRPRTIFAALAAGPVMGVGMYWFVQFEFPFGIALEASYAVLAVPIVLALILLSMAVFVGFASRQLDDAVLEWFSRCGGWITIALLSWLAASTLVIMMADLMDHAFKTLDAALSVGTRTSATVFTAIIPLVSSLAGMAARSGDRNSKPSLLRQAAQGIALPACIVLLLCSIAWADLRVLEWLEYHMTGGLLCAPSEAPVAEGSDCHPIGAGLGEILLLGGVLLLAGLIMSRFVPANRFSLHGMYRQRLIRTFLGSSRHAREPHSFTGFDSHDDLPIHALRDVRPLHVVNTTLSAVSSTHIGRHERQAQSFTFSPLHAGNAGLGYQPASEYGSNAGAKGGGVSMGTALAVSGAAASAAMGMYSSKSRAFLLTLANARLGLWFGNPQSATAWQSSEPPLGVGPVIRELLGLTTDQNPFVYLSDGGHYENLGLWEMVARRCRFIVVSDAGCDPLYELTDLANAVRRIRLDLGVPVEFPTMGISADGHNKGNPHCAVGVIRYSAMDGPGAPDGTILYVKATLSGDESIDVLNFAITNRAFPHESTGDQDFDEAQFESYRALGFHSVMSIAPEFRDPDSGVEGLCEAARRALAQRAQPIVRPDSHARLHV